VKIFAGFARRIGFGLALLALAGSQWGCATPEPSTARRAAAADGSASGHYLAGHFARSVREYHVAADHFLRALRDDPDERILVHRSFVAALAAGKMDDAMKLADQLREIDPADGLAGIALATVAIKNGEYTRAKHTIGWASDGALGSLFAPVIQAWAEYGAGAGDQALVVLLSAGTGTPFAPFYMYHVGLLGDALERPFAAETAYKELIGPNGRVNERVAEAFGRFLERQGRPTEARKLYSDTLARLPDSPTMTQALRRMEQSGAPPAASLVATPVDGLAEAFYAGAATLGREEAGELAEAFLRLALYLQPNHAPARMALGDLYESRRQWRQAIEVYRGVAPGAPQSDIARIRVALALNELDQTDDAVSALSSLAAERADRVDAMVALADVWRGKERYDAAAKAYDQAIARVAKLEERHWVLFYSRGVVHERMKQWPKAEADFFKALELKPEQPLVMNYLGYTWVDQGARLEEARRMIQRAVDIRPNDGYIVDSLGWALYRMGLYPDAVRHLERAVELRPEDPLINDHLGDVYWQLGRLHEARFQWQRSLNLKPEADQVPILRRKLESGLNAPASAANNGRVPGG
jgi:tetratricopeptide (TPR) repeat protein